MKKPYIICSAIHYDDLKHYDHQPINIETGYVLGGRHHTNIIANAAILGVATTSRSEQGFLTSDGRFVNREQAALIAINAEQIKEKEVEVQLLFSEDLY